MATGVLVLAVGEATKLVPWLTADDKEYLATIRLGIETDTLDAEGQEVSQKPIPDGALEPVRIEAALAVERARTEQIPPAYSAIRIGGERAHELARKGQLAAELPGRAVEVRSLSVLDIRKGESEIDVRIESAKGYFVRSLARDLAVGLGTVGHLTTLRRIRSGAFTIDDAVALDALSPASIIPLSRAAARALPVTVLDAAGVRAVSYGQRVAAENMKSPHACPSAWLDEEHRLVAIGECATDGTGQVLRGFPR